MLPEFFAQYIAKNVVSKSHGKIDLAKSLWKKYTKNGTELRKEMQLFEAIRGREYSNKEIAYDLLKQIRGFANTSLDYKKLEIEKTSLIREVNTSLEPQGDFFDKEVKDYADMATIQILINNYANKTLTEGVINPAVAELEDRVLRFMCRQKEVVEYPKKAMDMTDGDINGLVVKIMREKLNKKFSATLTEGQKGIVQQYVFGKAPSTLPQTLESLRTETLGLISEELGRAPAVSDKQKTKLEDIKGLLEEEYRDTSLINDTTIAFYMTISKLNEELKDKEKAK